MGMDVNSFKCPHCGAMMSDGMGPNWTVLSDAPHGRTEGFVIMLSCTSPDCGSALGSYFVPTAPAS